MVGVQGQGLIERVPPLRQGLARQGEHQVNRDVVEPRRAGGFDGVFGLLGGVDAVQRLEQVGVEGLNAEGNPVEARRAQDFQMRTSIVPGLASVVISASGVTGSVSRTARSSAASSVAGMAVGVPPPKKMVSTGAHRREWPAGSPGQRLDITGD